MSERKHLSSCYGRLFEILNNAAGLFYPPIQKGEQYRIKVTVQRMDTNTGQWVDASEEMLGYSSTMHGK